MVMVLVLKSVSLEMFVINYSGKKYMKMYIQIVIFYWLKLYLQKEYSFLK